MIKTVCPYPDTKAVIVHGQIYHGCDLCLENKLSRPNELAASHRRSYQQREYARDIVQPFEPGYVKARGIEAAREAGWSDDAIRKFG